jgi:polyhydroxyalkanoate synthesis regulator phasin
MMTPEDSVAFREKMVAALYGELSEEEMRDFQARLLEDAALRAEWEELREARAFLQHAEAPEESPEFVFLAPAEAGRPMRAPRIHGWRDWLRLPTVGFALTTAVLLALVVSGLRIDRVEGGLALRWGPSAAPSPDAMRPGSPMAGIPLEPSAGRGAATTGAPEVRPVVGVDRGYLTRAELVTYTQELVRLMGSDLDDYDRRRSGETVYMIREAYDDLARRQQQDYERLDTRIEEIRRALMGLREAPTSGQPAPEGNR